METKVEVTVRGFEAVRYLVASIPNKLPLAILHPVLEEVAKIGVDSMKMSIMRTTGEKATGHLVDSIDSSIQQQSEDSWLIQIGSPLAYAKYPAMDISATPMFRPVQIWPPMRWAGYVKGGKWRFIKVRPPMPRHPFLDETADAVSKALVDIFGDKLSIEVREVEAQTKALEQVEERI